MKTPRGLADLAFYGSLSPLPGGLEVDGDYDSVLIDDLSVSDVVLSGSRFVECAVTGVTFDGGTLRKCRMSDVWLGETRLVAVDLAESSLVDTWLSGCVLAGVQVFSALMRRVTFRGCKLDSVNFRDATLVEVTFEECVLREADFGAAKLTRVKFPGTQLAGAEFSNVTCSDVDLRGAALGGDDTAGSAAPGIRSGYDALRGTRIDSLQLMTLAPLLAHHLGITVDDT